MNRILITMCVGALVSSGCSLIDGLAGSVPEGDAGPIVILEDFPNDQLTCVWTDCGCLFDGCDPRESCIATGCRWCEGPVDCGSSDFCDGASAVCGVCTNYIQHVYDTTFCATAAECFYYDTTHDLATTSLCYTPPP